MNKLFKQYILTRFNLVDSAGYDVSYDYVNSDQYLSERFRLFELYCLPSVSNQSNSDFTWFVFFNDRLPEKWKQKFAAYKQICPNFEPRYMSAKQTEKWGSALNEFIVNELDSTGCDYEFILTSRIDNDDAFHLSYVDSVQKYFLTHREEAIINYTNGLQYILQYNALKNTKVTNGHFSTLIEKNSPTLKTVLSFSHHYPVSPKFVYLKGKDPMWLEIIHQTNVCNAPFFQLRYLMEDLFFMGFKYRDLSAFGIQQNILHFNYSVWKVFFNWIFKIKTK